MKTLKLAAATLLLWGIAHTVSLASNRIQDEKKSSSVTTKIDSQEYVFEASMVYPMRGQARNLTGDYTLKVSKDSVIAYLPFFGRAYSAPISPDENGIKFTSTKFEYKAVEGKKGGWDVTIKPKDVKYSYQLNLSISKSGYANLRVSSTNRESITFSGQIVK